MTPPSAPSQLAALILDPDAARREKISARLRSAPGWSVRVTGAAGGEEALARLGETFHDLAFVQTSSPHGAGLSSLERVRQLHPKTAIVAYAQAGTEQDAVTAMKAGAMDYLPLEDLLRMEPAHLFRRVHELRYLVDQNMELRQLSQMKTEFFANVSHELRTPLSVIIGYAQTLRAGSLGSVTDAQGKALDSIVSRSEDLLKTLNLILRLRETHEGKQQLVLSSLELRAFLSMQLVKLPRDATRKQMRLEFVPPPQEVWVRADQERLAEVVENLLSNAAKFGPKQSLIRVTLSVRDGAAQIAVADQGPGVAPEMLPRLFEQFSAAGQGPTREHGGLGLGLPLARQTIERHSGRIWLESKPDQGTTAFVAIPLAPKGSPGVSIEAPNFFEKQRVLVVEDNPEILDILVLFLSTVSQNLVVSTARSGPEALDSIKNQIPHAIILDVMMPGMDGFEVIERLRKSEATASIPIMVLTGYHEAVKRAKAAGAQEVMLKPFEKNAFVEKLLRLLAPACPR